MISLSYADRRTRLGTLILDLTLAEEITFESEASQFPVEDGTIISDHVTQGAERLRISGTIPTADVAALEADAEGRLKVVDVVEQCRRLHRSRDVLEVSTGQLLHKDFAFTRLSAARKADAEGGNWLSIDAELIKIRKVTLRTAEVPEERKVSPANGAQGRAGKTNTAAGKNAGANAGRANAGGEQFGPNRPPSSAAKTLSRTQTFENLTNSLRGL